MQKDSGAANLSIYDAIFAPLNDATRDRFRIGPEAREDNAEIVQLVDQAEEAVFRAEKALKDVGRPKKARQRADMPQSPWTFRRRDWFGVAKTTVSQFSEDRVSSVAGGVVFFGLLSLFPALTALVSLYGAFTNPTTIIEHLGMLERFLPSGAYDIIRGQVVAITAAPQSALSLTGVIALMIAVYSATGGMKAMFEALNVAFFTKETRGLIKRNLLAIGFTLGGIGVVISMLFVIAVIPALLQLIPFASKTEVLVNFMRWPIMLAVLVGVLAALYRWAPNRKVTKWDSFIPGALVAALGLVVASMLFSWYAANFANYNKTYGSLGAVIGLMMWLWIAAMVVMLGAEINSAIERRLRKINGIPDAAAHLIDA